MEHEQLPTNQFQNLRAEAERLDAAREQLIKQSRALLKDAKKSIQLVHQERLGEAEALLSTVTEEHESIEHLKNKEWSIETIGPYAEAIEEYVEATCFVAYAQERTLPTREELDVPLEQYIGGLSDLTGELLRRGVHAATKRDYDAVQDIHSFINTLYTELLEFHLRNGHLRKKVDSVRHNLRRIENMLYELELRRE